jgi:hypothetical protein
LQKRIKDKNAGGSMEGVIQKVKYIMEGREWNEVPGRRGVQNTVTELRVSQEIDKDPQYPHSTRLGTAKISNIQRLPVTTNMTTTNFRLYSTKSRYNEHHYNKLPSVQYHISL